MTIIAADSGRWATRAGRMALMAPAALLLALMLFWPLYSIVLRSLNQRGRAAFDSIYWGNYVAIAKDDLLRQVVLESLMLAVVATAITIILSFPTSYIISRLSRQMSSLMMVVIVMPFWVSIIVRLFAFTTILGQQGIINAALAPFDLGPFPLLYNTFATITGMVAYLLPYLILVLVSAMRSIDVSLLTAARTMGAAERQVFLDVYFPQIRPTLLSGTLLVFVLALGFFLTPAILGGPHNLTIPIFIQQQIQIYQWGKAAAMGVVLLLVSAAGYLVALRVGGKGILTPVQSGTRGAAADEPLKMTATTVLCWIALAMVMIILISPLLIVIPTAFTETTQIRFPPLGFTWKWFAEVVTSDIWIGAFMKSVRVGIATAIVSTLAGLALARVGSRLGSGFWQGLIQVVAIAPLIVPVILLAIGIFDVQGRLGLIGTDAGLVLAHAVLCVPLTFLVMANALSFVDLSMEQASWTMGASNIKAFWSIVVPNIIPSVIGCLIIAFVTSWDEAVIAMFQTGFDKTLPVTIYSLLRSGITPAVSAVAAIVTAPVLVGALIYGVRAARNAN
ncbi:ABC transporter permease subunit [Mesorhizobium sp. M3A.F.Ca.ET.080.04.2.1]|uniref:ABC transporter permease n=1 Tax=Mesorhizobium sp. M3A.F.Ca.ET.080.04.2.1 TaxID=2493676 RepID=UPI000F753FAA|nr:ABC transporter permease subunit [Mesorhizobium sp. M3A.F.Ca.ET.080.04.2.1]AZO07904.1 ABC transporter permease subunit [Mesorhizobium sp. M3A.F.Ca.ET.080.04.2.1]RWF18300.1 MAG: ABC transporter permease subunit [Mesorhizobium sp.]